MGVIRNSANRKIRGRVGDITYYISKDRQIARQALNNSNYGESARRSELQQNRRVRWANLVSFYQASKGWMSKAFESKKAGQTDYNRFMSVNVNASRIALTKEEASVGACVADAYLVSQGSLSAISVHKEGNHWDTDLQIGSLSIGASTTISQFTNALINNNNNVLDGDQISFISYQQYLDANNFPRIICTAYEVTLSKTSNELLHSYLPVFAASSLTQGVLGTGADISLGGFAYIISRNDASGRLLVSTQQLITNNTDLINRFSSDVAFENAIASYGLDADKFLDTGSKKVSVKDQPIYISSVYASQLEAHIAAGEETEQLGKFVSQGPAVITFSGKFPEGVASVVAVLNTSNFLDEERSYVNMEVEEKQLSTIAISQPSGTSLDLYVEAFIVAIGSAEYRIDFAPTPPIE